MTDTTLTGIRRLTGRQMLNKVPEITLFFWVVKVLCTTVGETAADYLNDHLGLGLTNTTWVMAALLVLVLVAQFAYARYASGIYWLAVVLISVVGTLITDNLTDNFGVSLVVSTIAFALVLAATFAIWFASERTLSIHTIVTSRREGFYWLAVLFTFALGTAAGDLVAERLSIGYWQSALIFGGLIAIVYAAHRRLAMNAILAFWIAYVLTRPLGASIGDFLSQPRDDGGLGLGTTVTSVIFLAIILAVVAFLTATKLDRIENRVVTEHLARPGRAPGDARRILVVTDKTTATSALVDAIRKRASEGRTEFVLLIPNPNEPAFDRGSADLTQAEHLLAAALPALERAAGTEIEAHIATSPNTYDDIIAELKSGTYHELIIETPPPHLPHWLHTDLRSRVEHLGYPLTTVTANH